MASRSLYAPSSRYQLQYESIRIPGAHRFEARLDRLSVPAAERYIELAADAWSGKYQCIGCHTTGTYLLVRPMITSLGPPLEEMRDSALETLRPFLEEHSLKVLSIGHRTAQIVYGGAGLASWDRYVSGNLRPETESILNLMFRLQQENGSWNVPGCWPPLQSSDFQLSLVAALGAAAALEIPSNRLDPFVSTGIDRLCSYLQDTDPPHDYAGVWLLWAGSRLKGVLSETRRQALIRMVLDHQNRDGGWSIRSFARPDQWGEGSRHEKLVSDPEFYLKSSDGHMTGLAVVALREAGFSELDPRIQKALSWIDSNQRRTGRWWCASLNTDRLHLITYSATCYSLLALWKCNALSRPDP
jgi:squalene-hopene/tetraprenyl-beta-curcumene cyclase